MTPDEQRDFARRWTNLFEAEAVQAQWVIKDLLPVGLLALVGPPKEAQKSTQALVAALTVAEHESSVFPKWMLAPNLVHRTGDVLYVSAEAQPGELHDIAKTGLHSDAASGKHCIYVANDPRKFCLSEAKGRGKLLADMDLVEPRLVILDPLTRLHQGDENSAGEMSAMMWPLREWAITNKACVLFVHHTRKLAPGEKTYRAQDARGTTDWQGMVDGTITVSPLEDCLQIEAIFKRGASWTRRLVLGTYGAEAREVLTDVDNKAITMLEAGESASEIARKLKVGLSVVLEAGKKKERNR